MKNKNKKEKTYTYPKDETINKNKRNKASKQKLKKLKKIYNQINESIDKVESKSKLNLSSDNEKDIEFQNKNNIILGELIDDFTNEEKNIFINAYDNYIYEDSDEEKKFNENFKNTEGILNKDKKVQILIVNLIILMMISIIF